MTSYFYKMKKGFNIILIFLQIFLFAGCIQAQPKATSNAESAIQYRCTPCGYDCDTTDYMQPGECPHCHMPLVKKSTVAFKTIQPADVCGHLAQHPDVVLLDVRTKEEFEGKANPDYGTLKSAINIPVQELESRLSEITALKNKEIIVYCSHSHRSPRACYLLTQNGFVNITNMAGGMSVFKNPACKVQR